MADFENNFWNFYVMAIVACSLLFCLFILMTNNRRESGPVELHGHVWDETLAEYNNPLPNWWLYLFWATLIFSVIYLAMYPGFGNFAGKLGWTSTGQYNLEIKQTNQQYAPYFERYRTMDIPAVAADTEARAMGERLFLTYCAQCHGSDAKGAPGFPNLANAFWQYGGDPDTIKETISEGRMAIMAPFGEILDGDSIKDLANYVRSLSGLGHDSLRAQRGEILFKGDGTCFTCHGEDAKGNPLLNAPDLTDPEWLWGSREETINRTITDGRINRMPGFGDFLGEDKVHLLTAYIWGLSNTAK